MADGKVDAECLLGIAISAQQTWSENYSYGQICNVAVYAKPLQGCCANQTTLKYSLLQIGNLYLDNIIWDHLSLILDINPYTMIGKGVYFAYIFH